MAQLNVVITAASWKVIELEALVLAAWACTFHWGVATGSSKPIDLN